MLINAANALIAFIARDGANAAKPCFDWTRTRAEAKALQKRYLKAMDRAPVSALSYAKRSAGYLMVSACLSPATLIAGLAPSWVTSGPKMNLRSSGRQFFGWL
jgi:hypothetical protein